jgi:adenylate cyclase
VNSKDFFAELKRRRVFKVTGIYAIVAWIVVQVAATTFPFLMLPDWTVRLVIAVFILGIPVVVILAWVFDITPEGMVRADGEQGAATAPAGRRTLLLPAAGAVLVLLATAGAAYLHLRPADSRRVDDIRSIAVLPFVDMSPGRDQEHFTDGIAEELLDALARIPGMHVPARSSSFSFKGQNTDVREIGRRLGVQAVLEGSIRKEGNRVRINAQLVSVRDGYHLWSDSYDRELSGVFAMQDEISRAVVDALRVRLGREQQQAPIVRQGTRDVEAYELYLRGRHFYWNQRNKRGFEQALAFYRKAIEQDPAYALAHAGMADAYADLATYTDRAEAFRNSRAAAEQALRLDPDLAEAHNALAYVAIYFDWDFDEAERRYQRVLELNPGYVLAQLDYGYFLYRVRGRHEEGLRAVRRAMELDPLTGWLHGSLSHLYSSSRRYHEALQAANDAIRLDPQSPAGHLNAARAYRGLGRFGEALTHHQREVSLFVGPDSDYLPFDYAYTLAVMGQTAEARRMLREIQAKPLANQNPAAIATVHAALGDRNTALRLLEQALTQKDSHLFLLYTPEFDTLRADPRFQDLRRRVGLQ